MSSRLVLRQSYALTSSPPTRKSQALEFHQLPNCRRRMWLFRIVTTQLRRVITGIVTFREISKIGCLNCVNSMTLMIKIFSNRYVRPTSCRNTTTVTMKQVLCHLVSSQVAEGNFRPSKVYHSWSSSLHSLVPSHLKNLLMIIILTNMSKRNRRLRWLHPTLSITRL